MSDETAPDTASKINPTAAATAARMRASEEKAAERLRKRGWVCLAPAEIADAAVNPMKYVMRDRAAL